MTISESLANTIKRCPPLYKSVILPYYFFRYLYHSLVTRSFWSFRYYPGHYGSTIPSASEIEKNAKKYFDTSASRVRGVDLNEARQVGLLKEFLQYSSKFSFPAEQCGSTRYYYNNAMFGFNDAFVLYCFLNHFSPKRVVEIGCGFSSALMFDVAETESRDIDFTFIEPFPLTFNRLIRGSDKISAQIIEKPVQDVEVSIFEKLEENDILFVDSSHVIKIGSDLSTIFFDILPSLRAGVIVHIHDIWWPFEYPRNMIDEGRLWNESYVVRSFLQFNNSFEIVFFNDFLEQRHGKLFEGALPAFRKDRGKSLWLKKIA